MRLYGAAFAAFALALIIAPASSSAETLRWTEVTGQNRPAARHESAAAVVGDDLFLIGGRGQRPLDILDLTSGAWRQGAAPPLEINHAQAVTLEGKVYVVGAFNGPFPRENIVPQILIYDPALDQWSRGADLPADRHRGGGGVVVHDGILYLVGGNRFGHQAGYVAWLDAFDPRTGEWTALADAPHARDHFHAAVLDGRIYAAGGRTSAQDRGQQLELSVRPMDIYDIAERRWTTAEAPLPTPRSGVSVVAINGRILVLGGESDRQQAGHAEVEIYDPQTGDWTTAPPVPVGRHGMQAVVVNDALHVIAGSGDRGGGPELNDHWTLTGF